jgi:hypothetical protein
MSKISPGKEAFMYYHSTRNSFPRVDSAQAVLNGLAPDGGLYVPEQLPAVDVQAILQMDAYGMATAIIGAMLPDIIFGSLATLLGALGTYFLRKYKWAIPIPPILANVLIIPWILSYVYGFPGSIPYFMLTVGVGEIISCGVLGIILYGTLAKYRHILFK